MIVAQNQAANQSVSVSGVRETVELGDRAIETIFYPAGHSGAPILFVFHGGGFVFGGHALNDGLWDALRNHLHINVVSVNYRKGVANPFPAALNDADEVIGYYLNHSPHDFARDKAAVMGSSAGANLSAAVCLKRALRGDRSIGLQLLCYPLVDNDTLPLAKSKNPEMLRNTPADEINTYFQRAYLPDPANRKGPLASPLFAPDELIKALPPAVIFIAEYDDLAPEAAEYAEKLEAAGVCVQTYEAKDMFHGYFEFAFDSGNIGYTPEMVDAANADGSLEREKLATLSLMQQAVRNWECGERQSGLE